MTDATTAPRITWKEILMLGCSMVGPAAIVGGALQSTGRGDKQVEENTRRIVALETSDRNITVLSERMARIETKLEMLVSLKDAAQ